MSRPEGPLFSRTRRALCPILLAGVVIALAACTEPNPGVNDVLPPLVVVTGHVLLPLGGQGAGSPAPLGTQILLGPPGTERNAALAAGRVVTSDGFYSVSIPAPLLPLTATEFEVQLYGSGLQPQLAAPLALSALSQGVEQDVDGATTIVALAVLSAIASGSDPVSWQVSALAALPEVQVAVPDLALLPVATEAPSALVATAASNDHALSKAIAAVLKAAAG